MTILAKKRDGFEGEKLISIPSYALQLSHTLNAESSMLYVTHIGYFPKASFHYRERNEGCADNILFYCLYGKGYYRIDGQLFELTAHHYTIIPACSKPLSYWADPDDPWTIYWIHFTGNKIVEFNQSMGIDRIGGPVSIPLNNPGLDIWEKIYGSLEMGYTADNLNNANLCLYQLIATFLYPKRHIPVLEERTEERMVQLTIRYMKDNLDKKISAEVFANLHKRSVSHFSLLFRSVTGIPPIDYFIHLKMQKACQLLYTTQYRIKEVAQLVGYDDPYYFSRIFKKHMNVAPEDYRASVKNSF